MGGVLYGSGRDDAMNAGFIKKPAKVAGFLRGCAV
jgi:hypothetical protein